MTAPVAFVIAIIFIVAVLVALFRFPGPLVGVVAVVLIAHVAFGIQYPQAVKTAVHDVLDPINQLHKHQERSGQDVACSVSSPGAETGSRALASAGTGC